jgi:RimJ/RimL family protein N-acetyltransferase
MPELVVPDPPLADDVVALRPFTLDDVWWVTEACRDPAIPRFTTIPESYEEADAREWIGAHEEQRRAGEALTLAIVEADGGAPLGSAAVQDITWDHLRGEIGYWVAPWGRRRGAATRAARLLAAHGFGTLGLERIEVTVYVGNIASQGVAEKAGCVREGVLRSYFLAHGVRHDCVMYALMPGEL